MTGPGDEALEGRHLGEVVRLFLRLGFTASGGPPSHICSAPFIASAIAPRSAVS